MTIASWRKSLGDVRSQTRYHFVYGTALTPGVLDAGTPEDTAAMMEAGEGSGAFTKSAKSDCHEDHGQSTVQPQQGQSIPQPDSITPRLTILNLC